MRPMTLAERADYYVRHREAIDEIRAKPMPPDQDYVPWFCHAPSFREVVDYLARQNEPEPDPLRESFENLPVGLDPFGRADAIQDPRYTSELPQAPGGGVSVAFRPGSAPDAAEFGAPVPPPQPIEPSRVAIVRDDLADSAPRVRGGGLPS